MERSPTCSLDFARSSPFLSSIIYAPYIFVWSKIDAGPNVSSFHLVQTFRDRSPNEWYRDLPQCRTTLPRNISTRETHWYAHRSVEKGRVQCNGMRWWYLQVSLLLFIYDLISNNFPVFRIHASFDHLAEMHFNNYETDLVERELGYVMAFDHDLDMFAASIGLTKTSVAAIIKEEGNFFFFTSVNSLADSLYRCRSRYGRLWCQ